jgi:NADH:ubiquinone oxidoreductase subunit 5 (subunit L)/multisubunit Na+/H+ antiporter MnhA subunit
LLETTDKKVFACAHKEIKISVITLVMIIMPWNWRRSGIWVLKVNLAFLVIDLLLLPFLALFFEVSVFTLAKDGFFPSMLLLDSGIIFLAGGLVAMSSSIFPSKVREHVFHSGEQWSQEKHKKSESKANVYIFTGVVLFLESVVLGFMT